MVNKIQQAARIRQYADHKEKELPIGDYQSITINLSNEDIEEVHRLAHERNSIDKSRRYNPRNHPNEPPTEITDVIGMFGEYIVSPIIGIPILTEYIKGSPDFIKDGWTIEVRTRSWPHGDLVFNEESSFIQMITVLVVPVKKSDEHVWRVSGYITRTEFNRLCHSLDWKGYRGSEYGLRQDELYPISRFIERFSTQEWRNGTSNLS